MKSRECPLCGEVDCEEHLEAVRDHGGARYDVETRDANRVWVFSETFTQVGDAKAEKERLRSIGVAARVIDTSVAGGMEVL